MKPVKRWRQCYENKFYSNIPPQQPPDLPTMVNSDFLVQGTLLNLCTFEDAYHFILYNIPNYSLLMTNFIVGKKITVDKLVVVVFCQKFSTMIMLQNVIPAKDPITIISSHIFKNRLYLSFLPSILFARKIYPPWHSFRNMVEMSFFLLYRITMKERNCMKTWSFETLRSS